MKYISTYRLFEKADQKVALILHGYGVTKNDCFYMWLKSKLEKIGYVVEVPSFPDNDNPKADYRVKYILDNYPGKKDLIIGHSFGACVSMKLVEKLNYNFDSLVLVSGCIDAKFNDKEYDEEIFKACDWKFNFNNIKSKTNVYILRPFKDTGVSLRQTKDMAKAFNEPINFFKEKEDHACGRSEPGIFDFISRLPANYFDGI
jgi:predicted alpha/beta hydrolase family esterase